MREILPENTSDNRPDLPQVILPIERGVPRPENRVVRRKKLKINKGKKYGEAIVAGSQAPRRYTLTENLMGARQLNKHILETGKAQLPSQLLEQEKENKRENLARVEGNIDNVVNYKKGRYYLDESAKEAEAAFHEGSSQFKILYSNPTTVFFERFVQDLQQRVPEGSLKTIAELLAAPATTKEQLLSMENGIIGKLTSIIKGTDQGARRDNQTVADSILLAAALYNSMNVGSSKLLEFLRNQNNNIQPNPYVAKAMEVVSIELKIKTESEKRWVVTEKKQQETDLKSKNQQYEEVKNVPYDMGDFIGITYQKVLEDEQTIKNQQPTLEIEIAKKQEKLDGIARLKKDFKQQDPSLVTLPKEISDLNTQITVLAKSEADLERQLTAYEESRKSSIRQYKEVGAGVDRFYVDLGQYQNAEGAERAVLNLINKVDSLQYILGQADGAGTIRALLGYREYQSVSDEQMVQDWENFQKRFDLTRNRLKGNLEQYRQYPDKEYLKFIENLWDEIYIADGNEPRFNDASTQRLQAKLKELAENDIYGPLELEQVLNNLIILSISKTSKTSKATNMVIRNIREQQPDIDNVALMMSSMAINKTFVDTLSENDVLADPNSRTEFDVYAANLLANMAVFGGIHEYLKESLSRNDPDTMSVVTKALGQYSEAVQNADIEAEKNLEVYTKNLKILTRLLGSLAGDDKKAIRETLGLYGRNKLGSGIPGLLRAKYRAKKIKDENVLSPVDNKSERNKGFIPPIGAAIVTVGTAIPDLVSAVINKRGVSVEQGLDIAVKGIKNGVGAAAILTIVDQVSPREFLESTRTFGNVTDKQYREIVATLKGQNYEALADTVRENINQDGAQIWLANKLQVEKTDYEEALPHLAKLAASFQEAGNGEGAIGMRKKLVDGVLNNPEQLRLHIENMSSGDKVRDDITQKSLNYYLYHQVVLKRNNLAELIPQAIVNNPILLREMLGQGATFQQGELNFATDLKNKKSAEQFENFFRDIVNIQNPNIVIGDLKSVIDPLRKKLVEIGSLNATEETKDEEILKSFEDGLNFYKNFSAARKKYDQIVGRLNEINTYYQASVSILDETIVGDIEKYNALSEEINTLQNTQVIESIADQLFQNGIQTPVAIGAFMNLYFPETQDSVFKVLWEEDYRRYDANAEKFEANDEGRINRFSHVIREEEFPRTMLPNDIYAVSLKSEINAARALYETRAKLELALMRRIVVRATDITEAATQSARKVFKENLMKQNNTRLENARKAFLRGMDILIITPVLGFLVKKAIGQKKYESFIKSLGDNDAFGPLEAALITMYNTVEGAGSVAKLAEFEVKKRIAMNKFDLNFLWFAQEDEIRSEELLAGLATNSKQKGKEKISDEESKPKDFSIEEYDKAFSLMEQVESNADTVSAVANMSDKDLFELIGWSERLKIITDVKAGSTAGHRNIRIRLHDEILKRSKNDKSVEIFGVDQSKELVGNAGAINTYIGNIEAAQKDKSAAAKGKLEGLQKKVVEAGKRRNRNLLVVLLSTPGIELGLSTIDALAALASPPIPGAEQKSLSETVFKIPLIGTQVTLKTFVAILASAGFLSAGGALDISSVPVLNVLGMGSPIRGINYIIGNVIGIHNTAPAGPTNLLGGSQPDNTHNNDITPQPDSSTFG